MLIYNNSFFFGMTKSKEQSWVVFIFLLIVQLMFIIISVELQLKLIFWVLIKLM